MSEGSPFDQCSSPSQEVPRSGKSNKHVKRPMNAFMVWAHERRKKMSLVSPAMHHSNISKILGAEWKLLSEQDKIPFVEKAKQIHEQHMTDNPDYKYRPQRKVRSSLKRSRPFPLSTVPALIAPSTARPPPVTFSSLTNEPFEIPIVGLTSVRQYSMEEYHYRQNALPHLTQKSSDFTNLSPTIPKTSRSASATPRSSPNPLKVAPSKLIPSIKSSLSSPAALVKPKLIQSTTAAVNSREETNDGVGPALDVLKLEPLSPMTAWPLSPLPPPLPEVMLTAKEEPRHSVSPVREPEIPAVISQPATPVPQPIKTPLLSSLRRPPKKVEIRESSPEIGCT